MLVNTEIADCYQSLFNHLSKEHNLILTISEMDEIINQSLIVVRKSSEGVKDNAEEILERNFKLFQISIGSGEGKMTDRAKEHFINAMKEYKHGSGKCI